MQLDSLFTYDSVALNAAGDGVVIVDQTLLPGEERFLTLRDESGHRYRGRLRAVCGVPEGGCRAGIRYRECPG